MVVRNSHRWRKRGLLAKKWEIIKIYVFFHILLFHKDVEATAMFA